MLDVGYFRVSKEDESLQDLEAQIISVKNKFNISRFFRIFKERSSAYDLNKLEKRTEFLNLCNFLFDANNKTIDMLFRPNIHSFEPINLYIWDYDRIMRNIQLNTLFIVLCDIYNVTIYSFKDGKTLKKIEETPSETFARYMLNSIHAFSGEQYSYTISTNIKKSVTQENGITFSRNGKKWGKKFRNSLGESIDLTSDSILKLNKKILKLCRYYEHRNIKSYYSLIIESVKRKNDILLDKSYISRLRGNTSGLK